MHQSRHARRAGGVKGRALLLFRLARQDIRHHFAQALLLVVAIAVATATLTMAFALNGVDSNPFQQTKAATKGPDVVAQTMGKTMTSVTSPAELAALVALNHAKGVEAHSGPYPVATAVMRSTGIVVDVEGRQPGVAAVDQPKVTDGTWIRSGGVVVERSLAQAANLRLGQTITLNGHPFQVVGFAVSTAFDGFPGISLMWASEAAARSLATKAAPLTYYSNLRLSDGSPRAVTAFVNAHSTDNATSPFLTSWTVTADQDSSFLRSDQAVLLTGATLLGLLALASVTVLVGGRLAEGTRRVGLLKAVGGTPNLVAATFLVENLFLALVAALVGLLAGWRAAPLISNPEAELAGTGSAAAHARHGRSSPRRGAVVALASTLRSRDPCGADEHAVSARQRASPAEAAGFADTAVKEAALAALFGLRLVARRRRAILVARRASPSPSWVSLLGARLHAPRPWKLGGGVVVPGHPQSGSRRSPSGRSLAGHPGGLDRHLYRLGDGPRRAAGRALD